jgi:hypothetical protein
MRLVPLALLASGCLTAPLADEPWEAMRRGAFGIGVRPGIFTVYSIEGDFLSQDFASGDPLRERDDGDVIGRYGAALRAEAWLSRHALVFAGADYRSYDVEGLNPIEELPVHVDSLDTLQYYLGLRWLLDAFPFEERLRPFVQASVAWIPKVDVGFEVDLSEFGSSDLRIDSDGRDYYLGGLATGVVYQWRDRITLELGVLYELPLNDLDTDLSFDIAGSEVPLSAELRTEGLIGFLGISVVL